MGIIKRKALKSSNTILPRGLWLGCGWWGTLGFRAFHADGMAIADPAMLFNLVSAHLRHSGLSALHPSCGSG